MDASLFYCRSSTSITLLLVYVDDILLTSSSPSMIDRVLHRLHQQFTVLDFGPLHYFLSIQVVRNQTGFHLSQATYICDILTRLNLHHLKEPHTLITLDTLSKTSASAPFVHSSLYRNTLGSLHYAFLTRPDISFAVNKLSQHAHSPTVENWQALKHTLRYLVGSFHVGLALPATYIFSFLYLLL